MIENTVLHDAVVEVLGVSVMERAAIVDALVAGAKVLGSVDAIDRSLVHLLQLDTRFTEVAAGVAHLPSLLEGTRWTVWIDADDAAEGYVRSAPNLEPLIWWLIGGDVLAVDGTGAPIGLIETDGMWVDGEDSEIDVVMPPGQILADLSGGWATVTVAGGALHWERCNVPPAPDQRQVAALRVGFGRSADAVTYIDVDIEDAPPPHLRFALGEGPIHEAILDDRTAFLATPSAPLADLYAAVGLERRGTTLAERGFDWDALERWRAARRTAIGYHLDPAQLSLYEGLRVAFTTRAEPTPESDSTIIAALDDSSICEAFWDACLDQDVEMDELIDFASGVVDRSDDPVLAGVGWLLARALDWSGHATKAADVLAELIGEGATHQLLFEDTAGFSADRGDAKSAYRLLQAAGVEPWIESDEGDESDGGPDAAQMLLNEVQGWATHRPPAIAGRNDRCPCGSGRKYKACHLGREEFALSDRAVWLYEKAKRFMRQRAVTVAIELAETMAGDEVALFGELIDSDMLADITLHEGRALAHFVAARGELLPDDERLLAERWTLARRSVFEVVGVGADRLELRDLAGLADIAVVNVTSSERTRIGSLLVGRPLPVGEHHRSFGGFVPITRPMVTPFLDAIASADAFEVAATYSLLFMPPPSQPAQ